MLRNWHLNSNFVRKFRLFESHDYQAVQGIDFKVKTLGEGHKILKNLLLVLSLLSNVKSSGNIFFKFFAAFSENLNLTMQALEDGFRGNDSSIL